MQIFLDVAIRFQAPMGAYSIMCHLCSCRANSRHCCDREIRRSFLEKKKKKFKNSDSDCVSLRRLHFSNRAWFESLALLFGCTILQSYLSWLNFSFFIWGCGGSTWGQHTHTYTRMYMCDTQGQISMAAKMHAWALISPTNLEVHTEKHGWAGKKHTQITGLCYYLSAEY